MVERVDSAPANRVVTPKRVALAGLIAALAITAALMLNPRLVSPISGFEEPIRTGMQSARNAVKDGMQSFASLLAGRSPGGRGDVSLLKGKKGRSLATPIERRLPAPDELVEIPEEFAPAILDEPVIPQTFAAADIPPVVPPVTFAPPTGGTPPIPLVPPITPQEPPTEPPIEPPVTPPAVPEPSTWMMMLLGFAFVGSMLKRTKSLEAPARIALAR